MVLSKEENLVPENSTQINLKTIAEKSDDPLKQEVLAGTVVSLQIIVELWGVLAA